MRFLCKYRTSPVLYLHKNTLGIGPRLRIRLDANFYENAGKAKFAEFTYYELRE